MKKNITVKQLHFIGHQILIGREMLILGLGIDKNLLNSIRFTQLIQYRKPSQFSTVIKY